MGLLTGHVERWDDRGRLRALIPVAVTAWAVVAAGPCSARAAPDPATAREAAGALAGVDSLLAVGLPASAADAALAAVRRWGSDPLYGWQVEGRAGAALLAAGRPREALVHLEAAIGAQPADSALRHRLGLALAALGRPGRALAEFEQAAGLDPAAVAPRLEAGRVRGALGDIAGARREWAAASSLCGGCPEPDRLLAGLLLAAGRPDEAVAPLQRLRAADPGDEVRTNLLAALAGAGQDSAVLELVTEREPEAWTPDEWRQAVQAEGRLGAWRLSRTALERTAAATAACGLPRDDDVFWAHVAANLLATGEAEASLAAIDLALGLRPGHGVYHHNRAAALAALGRDDEARQALSAGGREPMQPTKERP
jgi:tetratricopeptide (TPR) repeat protein